MRTASLALILLYVTLYLLPLGVRPLFAPDEIRYAELAREMIESGDWVVPRINGLRYFEKPILGYWLNSMSQALLGENAFAARFPSAICVGLTALLLFWLMRRFTRDWLVSLLTALVYLTFLQVYAVGTFNVLDSLLVLLLTAALVWFFLSYTESDPLKKSWCLALSGAMCGLAFLAKGFVSFAIVGLVIGSFLLWEKQWGRIFALVWRPAVAALLIALPWSIAIAVRESDFWPHFFWVEHVRRLVSRNTAAHPEPPWYYLQFLVAGSLPWLVFMPASLRGLRRMGLNASLVRYSLCWAVLPLLLFSASSGKRGTYITPCFPPAAILLVLGLVNELRHAGQAVFEWGAKVIALIAAAGAAILLVVQTTPLLMTPPYPAARTQSWVPVVAALMLWAVISFSATHAGSLVKRFMLYGAAPAAFLISLQFAPPLGEQQRFRAPVNTLLDHAGTITQDTAIVTDISLVHAVCWSYKRDDVYMLQDAGELAYGLQYDDAKHRLLDPGSFARLVKAQAERDGVMLIFHAKHPDAILEQLPAIQRLDVDRGVWFARF